MKKTKTKTSTAEGEALAKINRAIAPLCAEAVTADSVCGDTTNYGRIFIRQIRTFPMARRVDAEKLAELSEDEILAAVHNGDVPTLPIEA